MTLPGRADWLVWRGPELEGRLLGCPTVFVGQCPDPHDLGAIDAAARDASHVLFGPRFLVHGWDLVRAALDRGQLVTLEITHDLLSQLPPDVYHAAHLMLRFASPDIRRLKPSDTVKLTLGGVPGTTACFTWGHAVLSVPEQYDADSPVLRSSR